MTPTYEVERTIDAPVAVVWALLTDAASYKEWNDTVISIDGTIAEGEKIILKSTVDPDRSFKLSVTDVDAPRSMVWSSGMPLGLFRGKRTYTVMESTPDTVAFSMRETYSGPMASMITKAIPDLSESFDQFADSLKTAAETS
ncbi:MAG: SRPBCC domain-containing protein [Actinomycetia bacterium]|nr:SRPBCC domain-containing protein [Actinomycetes bacterium]